MRLASVNGWIVTFFLLGAAGSLHAADLAADIEAAKKDFHAVGAAEIAAARNDLRASAREVDAWLARGGRATVEGWHEHLQWNHLQDQFKDGANPDLKALQQVLDLLDHNTEGLEGQRFARLRANLRRYLHLLHLSGDSKLNETHTARLDALAKSVAASDKDLSANDAHEIGRTIGWLDRGGQNTTLVKRIRDRYLHPNFFVDISHEFFAAGTDEDVSEVAPIRENILGTDIHGTGHTVGTLTSKLVPSNDVAIWDIHMNGTNYSRNVGYNRGVTIHSTGVTALHGVKRVYMNAEGLTYGGAGAWASANTSVNSICAKCGLVERMAWKQVAKKEGQAEAIASGRARSRLAARMDQQGAERLAEVAESYQAKFRRPLLRRDAFPQMLNFSTSENTLIVRGLHAGVSQIAAPSEPPALDGAHAIQLRMHQSSVNNMTEAMFGRETLTDVKLADLMKDMTGEVPEELRITEDKDPWSITFAAEQPIQVNVDNNQMTISIRGNRFTRGETKINKAMLISANYKIEKTANGSKLTRQGDVDTEYVNQGRLGVGEIAFKTFLNRKFTALFKPEIVSDGLKLKGRWEKLGKLPLVKLVADGGWLHLAWDIPSQAAPRAEKVEENHVASAEAQP